MTLKNSTIGENYAEMYLTLRDLRLHNLHNASCLSLKRTLSDSCKVISALIEKLPDNEQKEIFAAYGRYCDLFEDC